MSMTPEARFVKSALGANSNGWQEETLQNVAQLDVPDTVLDGERRLFMADIKLLWAHWFVESVADPKHYISSGPNRPRIFADVLHAVNRRFANRTTNEQLGIASSVAEIVLEMAHGLQRTKSGRTKLSKTLKHELIDRAPNKPRCWICGFRFSKLALDWFLHGKQLTKVAPSPFVDILKPRGIRSWESTIEIDHVQAFAHGGGETDNLALACGWCNKAKSWYRWLHDADSRGILGKAKPVNGVDLPKPFWTVRLMGAVRKCEHPGCGNSADNCELTVEPIVNGGVLNPLNLRVTCSEHDSFPDRLQPKETAAQAWGVKL